MKPAASRAGAATGCRTRGGGGGSRRKRQLTQHSRTNKFFETSWSRPNFGNLVPTEPPFGNFLDRGPFPVSLSGISGWAKFPKIKLSIYDLPNFLFLEPLMPFQKARGEKRKYTTRGQGRCQVAAKIFLSSSLSLLRSSLVPPVFSPSHPSPKERKGEVRDGPRTKFHQPKPKPEPKFRK